MQLTPKLLKQYNDNNEMRHAYYKEAVERYKSLMVHFEGKPPEKLIKERRPSEAQEVFDYRMKIYESPTKPILSKVVSSLQKIRKSPEWVIRFDAAQLPASIAVAETPERYLTTGLPVYGSLTNYAFAYLLRNYLMDSNAWVAVQPYKNILPPANEYIKPVPVMYHADEVVDMVPDEWMLLKSSEKVKLYDYRSSLKDIGCVYYHFTTTSIQRWEQTGNRDLFTMTFEYIHNLGYLPCFQTYGEVTQTNMDGQLCDSRIAPMVPFLNEMAREYSDLQAEIVQHVHSQQWYYAAIDCTDCNGTGRVSNKENNAPMKCASCSGGGKKKIAIGSYEAIALPPPQPGDTTALPTPPAGYITKDTGIAELQDRRVRQHGQDALSSINMQYLDQTPINQSGVAKEVDRDELHNTVHGIAEDVVRILDYIAKAIVDMRYSGVVADPEARKGLYPVINVPNKYDLLTAGTQVADIKALKDAGVNSGIVQSAEHELIHKMFSADEDTVRKLTYKITLDPLAGMSADEIAVAQTYGAVSDVDAIIHFKITPFIDRALEEVANFGEMTKTEQMAVLQSYAQQQIAAARAVEPPDNEEEEEEEDDEEEDTE